MHHVPSRSVISVSLLLLAACAVDAPPDDVGNAGDDPVAGATKVIRTGWIPGPDGKPLEVTYSEDADGVRRFQGDIVLGRVWDEDPGEHPRAAIQYPSWPSNTIPYMIAPSIPNPQRILDAIAAWNSSTPYTLVPRYLETDYIMFDRHGEECSSPIGRQGGEQEIQVADGCNTRENIHEIGHALGFWHEQSRQDRDAYVNIDLDNVISDERHNFEKYSRFTGYDFGIYDYASIMHYPSNAFAIDKTRPTITKKDGSLIPVVSTFSPLDRAAIWYRAAGADPLRLRWATLTVAHGNPLDRPLLDVVYRYLPTEGGRLYQHQDGSVFEVHGDIARKFGQLGWATGLLGMPITDETGLPDGRGRFNHFRNGSLYWTATTGAHAIYGAIRDKWTQLGAQGSFLRYPITDELGTTGGRLQLFEGGTIYWSPATGAHTVYGAIRDRFLQLGYETGPLGFPTTDELGTPDGVGRFNYFQGGAIYWHPSTGAVSIRAGAVLDRWAQLGWETGCLGYPVAELTDWGGGNGVQRFQGGEIWSSSVSGASAYCYDRGWL